MITFGSYTNFEKTLADIVKDIQEQTEEVFGKNKPAFMNAEYNLYEQDSGAEAILEIELPGFVENEITSYLKDSILTVTAKKEPIESRNYLVKSFSTCDKEFKIKLPIDISNGIWDAELRNGILRYTIKKVAPKDNSMYINFKAK